MDDLPVLPPEWGRVLEAALGLPAHGDGDIRVVPLFGDGSDRAFYRVRRGGEHFVFLSSPKPQSDAINENDSTYLIGRHLFERGIPVPRLLWADVRRGFFLLEDVGDVHFQRLARRWPANRVTLYRKALAVLLRLHRLAPDGFSPSFCFDAPVYDPDFVLKRELFYFRDAFLVGFLGCEEEAARDLEREFRSLAECAGIVDPRWVIHRDFQSRNLMVCRGRLRVIDFQGMRHGPPAYDLASLLIDPYVGLNRVEEDALVQLYWEGARRFLGCSRSAFLRSYELLKLCRNLQALAAYAFLSQVKGKRHFLDYILPAWTRLNRMLSGPAGGRFPALAACVRSMGERSVAKQVEILRRTQLFGDKPCRN